MLWLSAATIDHANRVRPNPTGLKVGGHQASCASMVSIMTTLWFHELTADDRVSVKPHASPALHAVNHLLGDLPADALTTLRSFGGLQSYPSRTKDPDPVDYSTGSVGIGATAPIWGALARRYVEGRFPGAGTGRQYALLGDAELDEGACWEAVQDPMVAGLGEVVWIVDLNRQSLDRVVPALSAERLAGMFEAASWQVLTLKYGEQLTELFSRPGGEALRTRLDTMGNPEYQRLLRCTPAELRERLPGTGSTREPLERLIATLDDDALHSAVRNLGGHDLGALLDAYAAIDDTRPTVILAYTVKGRGLHSEGHPQNHSSLLTRDQLADLATRTGADLDDPWCPLPADSAAARLCAERAEELRYRPSSGSPRRRSPPTSAAPPAAPAPPSRRSAAPCSTSAAAPPRPPPASSPSAPTSPPPPTSAAGSTRSASGPRPSASTGSPTTPRRSCTGARTPPASTWNSASPRPTSSASSANSAPPGAAGASPCSPSASCTTRSSTAPWNPGSSASTRAASRSWSAPLRRHPRPRGRRPPVDHHPSLGLEQPGCTTWELPSPRTPSGACSPPSPSWALDGGSAYLRLSTRPVDQSLAAVPADPAARERRRRQAVAGAYGLRRAEGAPDVTLAAMGAMVPEALAAADRLASLGVAADVVCVTSPGLLFRATQARRGLDDAPQWVLDQAFPADRAAPLVTLLDGHPHTLAFLGTVHNTPVAPSA
ncbi:pyruvate dehydrogenase [Actinomadura keratinilytica]